MASLNVAARFDLIVEALTLVEEQGSVDLESFATDRSLTLDQLKQVLEPVLYLEFIDGVGNRYDGTHSYLVTERNDLIVDSDNWLRDAASIAPSPSHALQLLVAGIVAQSAMSRPLPDLDRALTSLNTVVDAAVTIEIARPRYLNVCEQALANGNVLHLRYFAESRGEPREYEIEPGFVGSNWGHWYLMGHVAGTSTPRTFRIDRIIEATETERVCIPDTSLRLSQWWDLEEERRTVRLRLPRVAIDRIPTPVDVEVIETLADEIVVADVTVYSDHRMTDMLVLLGTDAEITDNPALAAARTTQAARILAAYK